MLQTLHTLHARRQADLRHASRHRRLPDERVQPRRPARAARRGADHRDPSAADARERHQRRRMHEFHAINEVSLFRQSYQAARLRILVDGKERLAELVADGVLVATPAGSTAYNFSVQGPIIPISASLLALTPISPFRPRRWRGALLPDTRAGHDRGARAGEAAGRRRRRPRRGARGAARSTSAWTTRSPSTCCSIPATASTNAFCASSSGIDRRSRPPKAGLT